MKFIKKFEMFHQTGVNDGGEVIPEYNPVLTLKIKEYVDELCTKGEYDELAKLIGEKFPKDLTSDQMEPYADKLREKAIKHLEKNPELIGKEINHMTYKVPGGDGISRTNKVGGTSQTNSFRVGQ
jgi:hypothetical protein